jgi:hypothetical protein
MRVALGVMQTKLAIIQGESDGRGKRASYGFSSFATAAPSVKPDPCMCTPPLPVTVTGLPQ